METALAAAPVVLVLVLLVVVGWSASASGLVGAGVAAVIAVVVFDFGGSQDTFGIPGGFLGVFAEAASITMSVVAIIGPALAIHHLQMKTGATERLQEALGRLSPDPRISALLVAWFFTLFLEGAAGFGTPVALAAPFLVAAGLKPLPALVAALVGHAAGVSFGALGTPVLVQSESSGIPESDLACATAVYHLALGWLLTAVVVVTVSRSIGTGRMPWGRGVLAAVSFFVPYGLIACYVGAELPSLGGAIIGAVVFVVATRRRGSGEDEKLTEEQALDGAPVLRAGAAYLTVLALVLLTRLVPALRSALAAVDLRWELFGEFSFESRPLLHPAVVLTAAIVVGAVAQGATRTDVLDALRDTGRQLLPVVVALLAMVTIAQTMSRSGMTGELAEAAAGTGALWPLFAPAVGALGTLVTGSATASNILFTDLQQLTAENVGLPQVPLLGAQGFGAAAGNMFAPHNIVAGAAVVGLVGDEGRILRRTLPVALAYVVLGGVLAWWLAG